MSSYFLDTSVLLKRYVVESGTNWIQSILGGHAIIIAQIAPVEIISAVSRQKREGTISERTARVIRLLVNRHAVQLASALAANKMLLEKKLSPIIFACADNRLIQAAIKEGLQTHNPV